MCNFKFQIQLKQLQYLNAHCRTYHQLTSKIWLNDKNHNCVQQHIVTDCLNSSSPGMGGGNSLLQLCVAGLESSIYLSQIYDGSIQKSHIPVFEKGLQSDIHPLPWFIRKALPFPPVYLNSSNCGSHSMENQSLFYTAIQNPKPQQRLFPKLYPGNET